MIPAKRDEFGLLLLNFVVLTGWIAVSIIMIYDGGKNEAIAILLIPACVYTVISGIRLLFAALENHP